MTHTCCTHRSHSEITMTLLGHSLTLLWLTRNTLTLIGHTHTWLTSSEITVVTLTHDTLMMHSHTHMTHTWESTHMTHTQITHSGDTHTHTPERALTLLMHSQWKHSHDSQWNYTSITMRALTHDTFSERTLLGHTHSHSEITMKSQGYSMMLTHQSLTVESYDSQWILWERSHTPMTLSVKSQWERAVILIWLPLTSYSWLTHSQWNHTHRNHSEILWLTVESYGSLWLS